MERFTISVPYHYICELCAKDSGLLLKDITCTDNSKDTEPDVQMEEARKKCLAELGKQKEKVRNGNYVAFDGRCPHCGKHQSWDAGPVWDSVFLRAFAFAILPAVLIFILFSLGLKGTGKSFYSVPIALGAFLGFSVLLIPIFLIRWLLIRKDSLGVPQKNVPEIDWDNKEKLFPAAIDTADRGADDVPQPLSPQQIEEQAQSLMQTAQTRRAKTRTSMWLFFAGGVLLLVLPYVVSFLVDSAALAFMFLYSLVRVGGIALLVLGFVRLSSLRRMKRFLIPDNARGYVVAANARARLVRQHTAGWFCHKCGACNTTGRDTCFSCGTAYDAVQSENTFRQALEKYNRVVNMMK